MISQESIDKFTAKMQADGYVLGETFGFIAGTDWPDGNQISSDTLSRFWYKPSPGPDGVVETFSPWLASFLSSGMKLTLDFEVELGSTNTEAKYYTPKIEDFYIGYVYEKAIIRGIGEQFEEDGLFPVAGWEKTVVSVVECNDRDIVNIPHSIADKFLRTKYLDRKDIESLGWTHTGGQLTSWGRQDFETKFHLMQFYSSQKDGIGLSKVKIMTKEDPQVKGSYRGYDKVLYDGQCKSINELRKLHLFLNIQ